MTASARLRDAAECAGCAEWARALAAALATPVWRAPS